MAKWLTRNTDNPRAADIDEYLRNGGYRALQKALDMSPEEVVEEVKRAELRGRGGAGFPTGQKWRFAAAAEGSPKYLICNADEGEPGTFKDRLLMEKDPHLLVEGMVIAAYAVGCEQGYIYIRHEYPESRASLALAMRQARDRGFLGHDILGRGIDYDMAEFVGAGAYICGEETALIESLEGKRGQPRSRPPFPATHGLWGKPTVVNNVETLCNVPLILEMGGDAYARIGSPSAPGPKLYCLSGAVARPGVYEAETGVTLRELIFEHAGGMRNGSRLKGVIPGGLSAPVLPASAIDCAMDFESLHEAGSLLGSAGVIVIDESVCMVRVTHRAMRFYSIESCGKCVPCREGTGWLEKLVGRIEAGQGRRSDLDLLEDVSRAIHGNTLCPHGDSAAEVAGAMVRHFRAEFEEHVERGGCPFRLRESHS